MPVVLAISLFCRRSKTCTSGTERVLNGGGDISAILGLLSSLVLVIEIIGIVVVLISVFVGLYPYFSAILRQGPMPTIPEVRARLGRGLVLSLEIFVAADLVRTIQSPTLPDVIVLAVIALIRVVLSLSLEYELHQIEQTRPSIHPIELAERPHPDQGMAFQRRSGPPSE